MKWDGFRAVLQLTPDGRVTYWSRNGSDLSHAFPDLVDAARAQVPPGVVLDGEAVAWVAGRLSFDHLQHRMVSRPAAATRLARKHPASYIAFDLLAVDGTDVRSLPWHDRRTLLEELAQDFSPPLQIAPYTTDYATAVQWFTDLATTGIEGIVAKDTTSRYRPGERGWIKIKSRQQLDAVVGAVIGPSPDPKPSSPAGTPPAAPSPSSAAPPPSPRSNPASSPIC